MESELQRAFIESLAILRDNNPSVDLYVDTYRGNDCWYFEIGECVYYIQPQVELGAKDGVAIPVRADYVFWPANESETQKPVVVFTDSLRLHRDRIGADLAQRMALVQSGRYLAWTLVGKDVYLPEEDDDVHYCNFLSAEHAWRDQMLTALNLPFRGGYGESSLVLLLTFLRRYDLRRWEIWAYLEAMMLCREKQVFIPITEWEASLPDGIPGREKQGSESDECMLLVLNDQHEEQAGRLWIRMDPASVKSADTRGIEVIGKLDDRAPIRQKEGFESAWNGFMRLYNLFQFLPHTICVTSVGLASGVYEPLHVYAELSESRAGRQVEPPGSHEEALDIAARSHEEANGGPEQEAPDETYYSLEDSEDDFAGISLEVVDESASSIIKEFLDLPDILVEIAREPDEPDEEEEEGSHEVEMLDESLDMLLDRVESTSSQPLNELDQESNSEVDVPDLPLDTPIDSEDAFIGLWEDEEANLEFEDIDDPPQFSVDERPSISINGSYKGSDLKPESPDSRVDEPDAALGAVEDEIYEPEEDEIIVARDPVLVEAHESEEEEVIAARDPIVEEGIAAPVSERDQLDPWEELKELADPQVHAVLDMLRNIGRPPPEAGFELMDDRQVVIAVAELAYVERREAYLLEDQFQFADPFEAHGWTVVKHDVL